MIVAVSMATFKLKAVTNILPSGKNILHYIFQAFGYTK